MFEQLVRLLLTQTARISQYLVPDMINAQKDCVSCLSLLCQSCVTCLHEEDRYQAQLWIPGCYWSPRPEWDLRKIDLVPSLQTQCQPASCLWKYLILRWISLLRGLKSMTAHALIEGHRSDRVWHYLIYSFFFRATSDRFVNQYFFWTLSPVPWLTALTWWTQSSDETLWKCSSSAPVLFSLPLFSHVFLTEQGFREADGVSD